MNSDRWVLVEMGGWRLWRDRAAVAFLGDEVMREPDEQGVGRPPFPLRAGDQLEVELAIVERPRL